MSKRYLTVRNKGNEHEEQQALSISTRSSAKRASTNESNPTKKAKIDVDKENEPAVSIPDNLILPVSCTLLHPPDDELESDEESSISSIIEDEEEPQQQNPISSIADTENGHDHPTNKQYLIYETTDPNQEAYIISKTARYWSQKYRKVLRHVSPDAYGMYIHADFSCYGELEVVENCLHDLTKTIFVVQQGILNRANYVRKPIDKVNYVLAFRRLETLTILLDYTDGISGIDDGDRFYDIIRVIGACYVTILRGLLPKIMFEKIQIIDENLVKKLKKISKQIPNFKQVLEQAIIIGYLFLTIADICSAYTKVLQIIYCNWVFLIDQISIDFNEQPPINLNPNLWNALKHAAAINPNEVEHGEKESFNFMKELRSYKGKHGLGGDSYDLSKWSRTDRAAYALGRRNPLENFWFF